MALGLGMHREVMHVKQSAIQAERRRRLFWTLFCFDSGLSITTGRPTTSIDAFVDVHMPRNIDESVSPRDTSSDFCANVIQILTDYQLLGPDDALPEEVNYPTTSSAIIAQTKLAIIANEMHTTFWSVKTSRVEANHDLALTTEVRLFHWRNSLPRYFTSSDVPEWFLGPRAIVLWKEQNLRILLWRSSQRRHLTETGKSVARLKCYATAIETINDVAVFCTEHTESLHMGLNWYATYFLFQALLVLVVGRVELSSAPLPSQSTPPGDEASCSEAVDQGRRCLQLLDKPNSTARRCIEILDRLQSFSASSGQTLAGEDATSDHLDVLDEQQTRAFAANVASDAAITPDALAMQSTMCADPSLQMLLTDCRMDDMFRSVDGFPGTLDQDAFNYMGGWSFDFD
jgi:transcriptional regulatory protein GAL4